MSTNWVLGMPEFISKDKAAASGAVIVAWGELSQSLLRKLSSSNRVTLGCGNELGQELLHISYVNKLGPWDARNHWQRQICCFWCCHSGLMWNVSISALPVVFIKRWWHLGVGINWVKSDCTSLMSINWVLGMPEIISKDKAAAFGAVMVAWCELSQSLLRKLSSSKGGDNLGVGMNWGKIYGTSLMSTIESLGCQKSSARTKLLLLVLS